MLKQYGDFISKDTPSLVKPITESHHGLYDEWLESDKTKYPCFMDYLEAKEQVNLRYY